MDLIIYNGDSVLEHLNTTVRGALFDATVDNVSHNSSAPVVAITPIVGEALSARLLEVVSQCEKEGLAVILIVSTLQLHEWVQRQEEKSTPREIAAHHLPRASLESRADEQDDWSC